MSISSLPYNQKVFTKLLQVQGGGGGGGGGGDFTQIPISSALGLVDFNNSSSYFAGFVSIKLNFALIPFNYTLPLIVGQFDGEGDDSYAPALPVSCNVAMYNSQTQAIEGGQAVFSLYPNSKGKTIVLEDIILNNPPKTLTRFNIVLVYGRL